jgi:hypothetical protein
MYYWVDHRNGFVDMTHLVHFTCQIVIKVYPFLKQNLLCE